MFMNKKNWVPKNKPPEATVRVITVKSSKPGTPVPTPPHAPGAKRKREHEREQSASSSNNPLPSSSINASSRQRSQPRLKVPSPPRKRRRSPAVGSASHLNRFSPESGSEEEPGAVFDRFDKPKPWRTMREDPARDLPSRALKELHLAGYVASHTLRFEHARNIVGLAPDDGDDEGKENGKKTLKQANKLFPDATDDESTIELQYPGSLTRERFDLVDQKDKLDVIKDILKVVKNVRAFYITGDDTKSFDGPDGIVKRLKRTGPTGAKTDIAKFRQAIDDYNDIVLRRLKSGTTLEVIKKQHILPDDLVAHMMTQMYDRIITPNIEMLSKYRNGTDEVYGEMKSQFITQVLCANTQLSSKQVFVDLGSGVGNVVLQAALQIGCESWGCEFMPNPANLAKAQYKEFKARCELWGIQPGDVRLCHGDFSQSKDCPGLYNTLQRADVVLTNNKAFTPALNAQLLLIFLELKAGCRVVSLTDFSAASRHNTNDIANALSGEAEEYQWQTGWVSWGSKSGSYYVTRRT